MNKELAAKILAFDDRRFANVRVPEWGNEVFRLRSWTGGDRADFDAESAILNQHLEESDRAGLVTARVVAWSLVDDNNMPVFDVADLKHLRGLAASENLEPGIKVYRDLQTRGAKPLQRLYSVAAKLNLFDEDDDEALEKN